MISFLCVEPSYTDLLCLGKPLIQLFSCCSERIHENSNVSLLNLNMLPNPPIYKCISNVQSCFMCQFLKFVEKPKNGNSINTVFINQTIIIDQ